VIYVGKAKSLRQRLSNYFQTPAPAKPRTAQMVATAETVEWIEVRNEVEALMLEYSLIKQHRPRFNVRLRDDKSYPFLAVTVEDDWPRAGDAGPQAQGREVLRAVRPRLRHPRDARPAAAHVPHPHLLAGKFNQHQRLGRPCLLFHIEKCSGPCVGEVDRRGLHGLVDELVEFLDGDTEPVVRRLESEMRRAAKASSSSSGPPASATGSVRCRAAIEKQQMVGERRGRRRHRPRRRRARGRGAGVLRAQGPGRRRKGFVLDKVEDLDPPASWPACSRALRRRARRSACPSRCSCRSSPRPELYEEWLCELRGSRVQIRVPQRGDKRELHETVTRNAKEEFTRHRLRRAADHNSRARALNELQDALGCPRRRCASSATT
jgi:excinuclease ABC subunit C